MNGALAMSARNRDTVLLSLMKEQLAPWAGQEWDGSAFGNRLAALAVQFPAIFLFLLHGNTAHVIGKDGAVFPSPEFEAAFKSRAKLYQTLLQDALAMQAVSAPLVLAIDIGDGAENDFEVPVFSFQKRRGNRTPLLPDMEMVIYDYYAAVEQDDLAYEAKSDRAVFVGSTTGGGVITLASAQAAAFPRLRAAEFFRGSEDVDFRLTKLVQCENAEVEAFLASRGYGSGAIGWPETYQAKFGISIDGNGAACSRPTVLLRSNSVLVKYRSDFVLFYDRALIPGTHYLEVDGEEDILRIIAAERAEPGRYAGVAASGRDLARTILSRDAVLAYTSALISAYAAIVPRGSRPRR